MNTPSQAIRRDLTHLLTEEEVAERLHTTVDSVRWMRRKGRVRFIRIAGNRKVRFWWPHLMEDLSLFSPTGNGGKNSKQEDNHVHANG